MTENEFFKNALHSVKEKYECFIKEDYESFLKEDKYFDLLLSIVYFVSSKEKVVTKDKEEKDETKRCTSFVKKETLDKLFINNPNITVKSAACNSSEWILDGIRDSLSHRQFTIDADKEEIIIDNNFQDKNLKCIISFDWFKKYKKLAFSDYCRVNDISNLYTIDCNENNTINKVSIDNYLKRVLFIKINLHSKKGTMAQRDLATVMNYATGSYLPTLPNYKELFMDSFIENMLEIDELYSQENGDSKVEEYLKDKVYKKIGRILNEKIKNDKLLDGYDITVERINLNEQTNKDFINFLKSSDLEKIPDAVERKTKLKALAKFFLKEECSEEIIYGLLTTSMLSNMYNDKNTNKEELTYLLLKELFLASTNYIELGLLYLMGTGIYATNKDILSNDYITSESLKNIKSYIYIPDDQYTVLEDSREKRRISAQKDLRETCDNFNNVSKLEKQNSNRDYSKAKVAILKAIQDSLDRVSLYSNSMKTITQGERKYIEGSKEETLRVLRNCFSHLGRIKLDKLVGRQLQLYDYDDNDNLSSMITCSIDDLYSFFTSQTFEDAIDKSIQKVKK